MTDEEKAAAEAKAAEEKAAADKAAADKAASERKRRGAADPNEGKVVLTPEEHEAQLAQARKDAVAEAKAKADEQRQKEKDEAERKAAEEQGKWKELNQQAEAKLAASETRVRQLELDLKRAQVKEQVREVLDKDHKHYVGTEKYILPTIDLAAIEDLPKRIKAAVDAYVKDNPRSSGGGVSSDGRSGVARGTDVPRSRQVNGAQTRPVLTPASRM